MLTPVAPSPFPVQPAALEAELASLVRDQERDDQYRVHSYSLDALPIDITQRPRRLTVSDDRHGTLYCYVKLLCRCARCRAVSAAYARDRRRKRRVAA